MKTMLLILLFSSITCFSQHMSVVDSSPEYIGKCNECINESHIEYQILMGDTLSDIYMIECVITNKGNQSVLTWINPLDGLDNVLKNPIRKYFLKRNGDFCFLNLMTDNMFFPGGFKPIVGFSFLKCLKPKESFKYIFIGRKEDLEAMDVAGLISVFTKKDVEKEVSFKIPEMFLFNGDYIIIPVILGTVANY